jgi:mTERF domain-containing protein
MTRDFHLKVAILGSLGVTDIAKFVAANPRIVNLDVEKDMRPAVELLR